MDKKILIIIIGVAVLAIAGFFGYKFFQGPSGQEQQKAGEEKQFGQKPGVKDEESGQQTNEKIPEPPKGEVAVYKGFWMPCGFYYDHKSQSMSDPRDLKDARANIASIAPNVRINSKGEVKFDAPFDYVEQSLAYWAKNYYENGIRISLVIEVSYQEDLNSRPNGEPKPVPRNIAGRPGFLDEYNKIAVKIAQLAEKYRVEMFSPMNEPDLKLGEATASAWGQAILPEIKKYYHGKILWKAAGSDAKQAAIDFSGYDIIGFDPTPGGGNPAASLALYPSQLRKMIELAQARAKKYNVPAVMITEFGVWGGALAFSEENKMLAHRIVFEEGQGKVAGFIALDPPPDLDRGLKGTASLAEIKKWFEKL